MLTEYCTYNLQGSRMMTGALAGVRAPANCTISAFQYIRRIAVDNARHGQATSICYSPVQYATGPKRNTKRWRTAIYCCRLPIQLPDPRAVVVFSPCPTLVFKVLAYSFSCLAVYRSIQAVSQSLLENFNMPIYFGVSAPRTPCQKAEYCFFTAP